MIEKIKHNGIQIWLFDFSNLEPDDLALRVKENITEFLDKCGDSTDEQFIIADVSGTKISNAVVENIKGYGDQLTPLIKTLAVVGITGIKKVLLDMASGMLPFKIAVFQDRDSAFEWLKLK